MVYEIVSYRFSDTRPVTEQQQRIEAMDRWVKTQPGFVGRSAFYDAQADRWVDLVTWTDLASAHAAMERSQMEPSLATIMDALDTGSIAIGHYEQRLVETP
ncbi:MAG: hypothetical protein INH02_11105 [Gemmatimonas sp.]|uniref:hypothetical protein n=1 Tax=Gemmatimonas sp. TaxID=1962908 RepID=UPI0025BE84BF|nr:hypothetical protein [Gemmatimonas sp.]MCA2987965.1 hypothetical protein [Gemmatimonas sp.]